MTNVRILLAEDEEAIREGLKDSFPREAQVTAVCDGRGLLAEYGPGGKFDLIITDDRMPGIGGMEAVRRIRAGGDQAVQIWLMSGSASESEAKSAGADRFYGKPASGLISDINEFVRRYETK